MGISARVDPFPVPSPGWRAAPRQALRVFGVLAVASWALGLAASSGARVVCAASDVGVDPEVATSSRVCAVCHPAIYAEHVQNTHGAAFLDEEARLATRDFRRENCVRCHTPRPVYETGLGMVPVERRHDLEEGNTCMTCHGKAGYDYARFRGGAECKTAFDDRVGSVEACATCHRIAGTPEQWEHAREGKLAGRACVVCHMPLVERPVAVGAPPRAVRAHLFPASRSEDQLRRAYRYEARIEGGEVVVSITNVGAGHNFPTATVQRSLESRVVVRDVQGKEVVADRAIFKHPYADPASLDLPRSMQIPSGATRQHRVPIPVGAGTVECELLFKLYYPIADDHPTLSRRLEWRTLRFVDVVPSVRVADATVLAPAGLPAVSPADAARADGFAKFAHPAPGTVAVAVPEGDSDADLARLVAILEFPVPGARARARERLVRLGARAVPVLVEALGHWSDETRDQATTLLVEIGEPAVSALRAARTSDRVYVRYQARAALARSRVEAPVRDEVRQELMADLALPHPLDRRSAADALGALGDAAASSALRPLLGDVDWDVVASAARALARLDDRRAVPAMEARLRDATFVESRRDLAASLASLGSAAGIPALLDGLDHPDDVIRRSGFDAFFASTGLHASYDPDAPRPERLEALARLRSTWAQVGGASSVRRAPIFDAAEEERAWLLVEAIGGGTDTLPGGDDPMLLERIVAAGAAAVAPLVQGLTFPAGFSRKRAIVCEALGRLGDPRATPYLVRALRDPDLSVASWACWALATTGDGAAVPALRRWSRRLAAEIDARRGATAPEPLERLLARAAWVRARLGDDGAAAELDALGGAGEGVVSGPPSRAVRLIETTEAAPVSAPTSPADAVAKGRALRAQDFYEDAVRVLRDADAHFGPTAAVRLETAWNLLMIGEEDVTRHAERSQIDAEVAAARTAFEEALRMDPHVAGQDLLQAKLLRYEGEYVQARLLLKRLVEDDPADVEVHREFADLAYTTTDWVTAEREYATLSRLDPKEGWSLLFATIAGQWLERPSGELESGYLAAAHLLPEERAPLDILAGLYPSNPARNASLLEKVIVDRPGAVEARVVLAGVLARQAPPDRERAVRLLREAIAIAPGSPSAHRGLGTLLAETGRAADAVTEYLAALALDDKSGAVDATTPLEHALVASEGIDAIPADLRLRGWEALVARDASDAAYAHEAGVWYLDVARDVTTAKRFLEAAAARNPVDEAFRRDLLRAREASDAHK